MKAAAAVLCAAALLAGCAAVEGRAEPENATATEPSFNPCDDIPDAAIRAIGMDPATEVRDILGVHQPGWNLCAWNDDSVAVSVYATRRPLADMRDNSDYSDFQDLDIEGRQALKFRTAAMPIEMRCYVAVGGDTDLVMVAVTVNHPEASDSCAVAQHAATVFQPFSEQ